MKNYFIIILIIITILFVFPDRIYGEENIELSELTNPDGLIVNENYIVIYEGINIYIYSKKSFKLLKKFGKKGDGPGEFKGRVDAVHFLSNSLAISSRDKMSFFSFKGVFIKEIKSKSSRASRLIPAGDNYVGQGIAFRDKTLYLTINLYNDKLEKTSTLFEKKAGLQRGKGIKIFYSSFDLQVYLNKIYIAGKDDLILDVFDANGKKLPQIKLDHTKTKVLDKHIDQVYEYFKTNPETKAQFNQIKKKLEFPKYFPAIRSILVNNNIYIQTYIKKNNKTKFNILNLKGELIKSVFIPVKDLNILESFPFTIYKNNIYQVIEDEETETWKLNIVKII